MVAVVVPWRWGYWVILVVLCHRCPCLIAPCPHPTSSHLRWWLGVLFRWWPSLYHGSGGYWVVLVIWLSISLVTVPLALVVIVFFVVLLSSSSLSHFRPVCYRPFVIVLRLAPSFLSHCSPFPPTSNCSRWRLGVLSSWLSSSPIVCRSMLSALRAGARSGVAIPVTSLHCCRCH